MTGVLEHRSCYADWTSPQPQTFQTYREALRLSTDLITFLITVGESRVEIRRANLDCLALVSRSAEHDWHFGRTALAWQRKILSACVQILKDLLIELPRVHARDFACRLR